jgi:hypothetical protein
VPLHCRIVKSSHLHVTMGKSIAGGQVIKMARARSLPRSPRLRAERRRDERGDYHHNNPRLHTNDISQYRLDRRDIVGIALSLHIILSFPLAGRQLRRRARIFRPTHGLRHERATRIKTIGALIGVIPTTRVKWRIEGDRVAASGGAPHADCAVSKGWTGSSRRAARHTANGDSEEEQRTRVTLSRTRF